ncbi:MAG: hypothetical protein J0M18_19435 [Ignavibacteria bacterium]|nr:hypothetical protein [Ignavibacteria bacterium]
MKCIACRADEKFVRTFETIQHEERTERRKLCMKCGSSWKTWEYLFERIENPPHTATQSTKNKTKEE